MTTCRSCRADIVWVRTAKRKLMPVDSNLKVENAVERDATATFEELREKLGAEVVVSHFSSCDRPDEWRNPR